jgi:hypothetical protein
VHGHRSYYAFSHANADSLAARNRSHDLRPIKVHTPRRLHFFLTHFTTHFIVPSQHIQQWVQLWESTAGLRGTQSSQLERVLAGHVNEWRLTSVNVVRSPYRSWAHASLVSSPCILAAQYIIRLLFRTCPWRTLYSPTAPSLHPG